MRVNTEVTRRDGLSSLKSNILSPVGMLSGSWGGNYVWQVGWKSWILKELHQFKIAGYIFLSPTRVIALHMQNLSSIHRLSKKFRSAEGFGPWGWNFENDEILLKSDVSWPQWTSKSANRRCWRISPPSGPWKPPRIQKHKWLVEKVPRRVIVCLPEAILHQRWAGHRYAFRIEKSRLLAISWMDFTFEISTLHNF